MAARKSVTAISVSALIADLKDPQRSEVETLRALILGVAKGVGEEVKWNSPSFHTGEHFATMRLNGKILLQLIRGIATFLGDEHCRYQSATHSLPMGKPGVSGKRFNSMRRSVA